MANCIFEFEWEPLVKNEVFRWCDHRDSSHGGPHMEQVASNTKLLLQALFATPGSDLYIKFAHDLPCLASCCVLSAWLHDVIDHKYNDVSREELSQFLIINFPDFADTILNVISRVSFSKERSQRLLDPDLLAWLDVLGEFGMLVRDIVSDADKLEAIGERGFLRCLQYNLHLTGITTVDLQTPSSVSPHMEPESDSHIYSTEQLSSCTIGLLRRVRKDVLAHAEEKLYHLRSEYMRSDAARALALPLEAELRALFEAIAHDDVALVQWIRRALEIV